MRRWSAALIVGGVLALGASPSVSPAVPTVSESMLRAMANPSGPATLASAAAFADSLETGISLVRVRIVDTLDLGITLVSDTGVTLAQPPELCLAWVFAGPDDAGLESPCWGIPDPSTELASLMARDDGTWALEPAHGVAVHAQMTRGGGRCDFPPGEWVLRVKAVPVVDGVAQEPMYVRAPFEVAYDPTEVPTRLPLTETRFCGLASEVVREQGVPPTAAP
jgi:hypothetical protein